MIDIKTISNVELKKDLDDSYEDILNCEAALKLGITEYSSGTVLDRLNKNKQFVKRITDEIKRRESGD